MSKPNPKDIKNARARLSLTQAKAAGIIHKSTRVWQQWEGGQRNMPMDSWELFLIKTGISSAQSSE